MKRHAILFSRAVKAMTERGESLSTLLKYDTLWIDDHVYSQIADPELVAPELAQEILARSLIYADPYGKSRRFQGSVGWLPGPGDWRDPPVRFFNKTWGYRFDDAHITRFILACCKGILRRTCKGLGLDDFYDDRHHWENDCDMGDEGMDLIWPEWREGREWNKIRMEKIESGCRGFCALWGKELMLNSGGGRQRSTNAKVLFEGLGPDNTPGYWDTMQDVKTFSEEGDYIHFKCLDANGQMPEAFKPFWEEMLELAEKRNLSVGRSFAEFPNHGGGSTHSNTESPDTW